MIQEEPPATVVIVPVAGMLPHEGPFDVDANMGALKRTLIEEGLQGKVRKVVFIGDYTKHLASKQGQYGPPVYPAHLWRKMFDTHRERIAIVTTPPPALRKLMNAGDVGSVVDRNLTGDPRLSLEEREYDPAAKLFDQMSRKTGVDSQFYEALT